MEVESLLPECNWELTSGKQSQDPKRVRSELSSDLFEDESVADRKDDACDEC